MLAAIGGVGELPLNGDEIDAAWLQTVLAGRFVLSASSLTVEQIGVGYGLASTIFRCRFEADGAAAAVVVKLWPTSSQAGTHEITFYRTLAAHCPQRLPLCYFGAAAQGRGVLVLEDLQPALQGDDLLRLPPAQALRLAAALGQLHGRWFGEPLLVAQRWLRPLSAWRPPRGWIASRRGLFLQRFGEQIDPSVLQLLQQAERLPAICNRRLAGAPSTLLHSDLHLDNVLLLDGELPVLIDWAGCRRGAAAFDLYRLLFNIGPVNAIEPVLASYLAGFAAAGGPPLDRERLWRQLGGAFLYHFALATLGVARWQPSSEREVALIDVSLKRIASALVTWGQRDPQLFGGLL